MSQFDSMLSNVFGNNAGEQTAQKLEESKLNNSKEKNEQLQKTMENAPFFVTRLEHAAGTASMLDFVNFNIKRGSPLNIKDDIIYFDNLLSSKVLMGRVRPNHYDNNGVETDKKFNPFLCSYFDFIAHTKWDRAYVWQDRIYLMANQLEFNSYNVKSIPAYTLAIKVDNLSKFEKWENQNALDIRKIIFAVKKEEIFVDSQGQELDMSELEGMDSNIIPDDIMNKWSNAREETISIPVQTIEETVVEQTIPLEFLTQENHHLIYSANRKKLEYEKEKLQSQISQSAESKTSQALMQNSKLFNFYNITTENQMQQDYGLKELEFAREHQINEKEMGWDQFRQKTDNE